MELNRNHYLGIGMILLLLGLQFRFVDSFQLNEATTKVVAKRMKKEAAVAENPFTMMFANAKPSAAQSNIHPPKWIGWSLLSIGGVLVVQSLGMRKPGA